MYICAYSADCRKDAWANCYTLTFLAAIVWISAYSYMMVWMITVIGFTLNIPDTVMGLTFIAAGVSVPDALSGIAVIREGTTSTTYTACFPQLACILQKRIRPIFFFIYTTPQQ